MEIKHYVVLPQSILRYTQWILAGWALYFKMTTRQNSQPLLGHFPGLCGQMQQQSLRKGP